jgi:hypothetical protein
MDTLSEGLFYLDAVSALFFGVIERTIRPVEQLTEFFLILKKRDTDGNGDHYGLPLPG